MKKSEIEWRKWIPISLIFIVLMVIYKTIDNIDQITSAIGNFLSVISPLLFGVLFTYFLFIPHRAVERVLKKFKIKFIAKRARGFSTIIIFLLLLLIIVLVLSFVVPIVVENVISLANSIPGYISTVLEYFDNLPPDSIWINLNIADTIKNSSGDILNTLVNPDGIGQVAQGVMGFVGGIFSLIMGLVISLYMLLDRDRIFDFFRRLNNAVFRRKERARRTATYMVQVNKVLLTFIASKGLDSLINFTVATTILFIFGVDYALLLGLIAGAFNFIPFLGSIISAFIISAITLITGGVNTAIYVMICLLVFHQLDGNFIEPRIMKSSLKINPILVIIAVVVGGAYFGIVGMFLAVPIVVMVKQILLEYVAAHENDIDESSGILDNVVSNVNAVADRIDHAVEKIHDENNQE
ncbi:MAG: AI-2E family transporter [Oscillospiraceae bacterium]|nr:AI-2E family transporter [Oscillospiraceae bacterium]